MIKTKHTILIIFLFILLPIVSVGQIHRSEIIDMKKLYQLKGDKLHLTGTTVIQINNRMGDNDAGVYIHYSKGDRVKINDAWIQDIEGNVIRKLKKNEIEDVSAVDSYTLYSDRLIKKFKLIHNERPYQLVYNYEIVLGKYISIETIDYRNRLQPIKNAEIVVEAPSDKVIKYTQENIDQPKIENIESGVRYTWSFNYFPPNKFDVQTNYNSISAPLLMIVPQTFNYGETGDYTSWQSFGEWIWKLNEGRDILPESERKIIDKLVKDVSSPIEKAKILYHYMQDNTRYVNVSIKIGGLQTYPAEYVCTNRYGDCKALTNYMQALLKYAGINSYYTIIEASKHINDFDLSFPKNAFNHVILTIPMESDTTYLECTSQNLAFGYINTSIQGRKALLIDKNNSKIINIPSLDLKDIKTTRLIEIDLRNNMQSTGYIISTQKGLLYELYKEIQNGINKNIADNYIHNNILDGSYSIENYEFIDNERDSSSVSLKANFTMNNIVKKFGNNIAISPFSWRIPAWELPEKRKQNIQIDYPIYKEDTILYKLNNYKINKKPENINITTLYGEYIVKYNIENDNLLRVCKSMKIYSGRYDVDLYDEFYNFVSIILNNENKNFYIEIL